MEAKPMMNEVIARAEKKVNMTLDDIIKMSKADAKNPAKQRVSNRSQKFVGNVAQEKSAKLREFMDSRSSLRQGVLAQRRSNFQGNQFPLASEAARKATAAPIRGKPFNQSRQFIMHKQRVGAPAAQKKTGNKGGFIVKRPCQHYNVVPEQNLQTLNSRFAVMNNQRTRVVSQQNNGPRRNGGGQTIVPWARNRIGN